MDTRADGGTHVRSTGEIGRFEGVETESKGTADKRLRIGVHDAETR
jgi:Ser-tRNA(Ala) deacylase AlaX